MVVAAAVFHFEMSALNTEGGVDVLPWNAVRVGEVSG